MDRRSVLAGVGLAFGTSLGGCLERFGSTPADAHCRGPDDDAETVDYDEIKIVGNENWLATEYPRAEPHLVLVRSQKEADEWIDYGQLEDEDRTFVDGTAFGESSLLVAEASVTAGYQLVVHGIEWLDTGAVSVYHCEEDHREDGQEYPAVDTLRSRVLRLYHGDAHAPTSAEGIYVHTPTDPEELAVSEYDGPARNGD